MQVDVTAADSVGQGQIPAVNTAAAASAQATGMINTALQHMGLGPDPWKAIKVGVRRPSPAAHRPSLSPCALGVPAQSGWAAGCSCAGPAHLVALAIVTSQCRVVLYHCVRNLSAHKSCQVPSPPRLTWVFWSEWVVK